MLQPEKLFSNIFGDKNITSRRLSNFAADVIIRFNNIDTNGIFKTATQTIVTTYQPFHDGLSVIDTSLGLKKGKTQTVDEVTTAFGAFMKDYQNDIARKIGGVNSPDYLAFYPQGIMEYTNATKTQMPLLAKRVYTLASTYTAQLGGELTAQLQQFLTLWNGAIDDQTKVNSNLSDGRAGRSKLRHDLELALLTAIHLVAIQYPDDVAKCMSFFDFNLLTAVAHSTQTPDPAPPAKIA